jgi:adenine-specific DNA-methyltransferase
MSSNMIEADLLIEQCVRQLGSPYCRGANYAVFCMDCLAGMQQLTGLLFDLTITSPPYNIGKEYEKPLPLGEYIDWCRKWMEEVHRLTLPCGAFWLNVGYVPVPERARALPLPYLLWDKCPFFFIQEVVWNYGAGVAARRFLSPRNEKFLWFVKDSDHYTLNLDEIRDPDVKYPRQKKNGKLRCNTIGKNPSDVWQIAKVTSGTDRASPERAPHPAQFPLDLIHRIVKGFSNRGNAVLDPFMGSGSTAESCVLLGRSVIGFEVRRDYCEFAAKRLKRASAQSRSTLFEIL